MDSPLLNIPLLESNLLGVMKGKLILMGSIPNQWQQLSSGVITLPKAENWKIWT
uniref:Uncharacterized protein n=1 Tax=Solanum tuberosum TaxID=4113 RepID=M1APE7_SOLTU